MLNSWKLLLLVFMFIRWRKESREHVLITSVIAVRKLRGFNNTDKSQARLESLISKVRGRGYQFMNKRVFMMGYVVLNVTLIFYQHF